MNLRRRVLATVVATVLVACSSTPVTTIVTKPEPDSLPLGTTRYSQVVDRFGPPTQQSTLTRNGESVRMIAYTMTTTAAPVRPNIAPKRALQLYFLADKLVGYDFVSSYAQDATDFDDIRARRITKGRTSRADVVQLIGSPTGAYIFPMINLQDGRGMVYQYAEQSSDPFDPRIYQKKLTLTIDAAGRVADMDLTSSGRR